MTLARITDADIGQRPTGYDSDVMYSLPQQPKSRDHKQTWEIRNKTLPQVTAISPMLSINFLHNLSARGHFYLTLHLLLSHIDILPTPTNSPTIGYIWRVTKYCNCIVLYCTNARTKLVRALSCYRPTVQVLRLQQCRNRNLIHEETIDASIGLYLTK